jgi:hypothetical protein
MYTETGGGGKTGLVIIQNKFVGGEAVVSDHPLKSMNPSLDLDPSN